MLIKMENVSSDSGGGTKIIEGEFQSSSSDSVEVTDIGFKADYLYIYSLGTVRTYKTVNWYMADVAGDAKKFTTWYTGSDRTNISTPSVLALSTADTIRGALIDVTDDGFVWCKTSGNGNYDTAPKFWYRAVKWEE